MPSELVSYAKPSRELDALIAEKVMGWHREKSVRGPEFWADSMGHQAWVVDNGLSMEDWEGGWNPSELLQDAWSALSRWKSVMLERVFGRQWTCRIGDDSAGMDPKLCSTGEAETVELAICRATLAKVGVEVVEEQ